MIRLLAPAPISEYSAEAPWQPDRPEALVICCSDGRWHAQVEEFIVAQVSRRADVYAVPGGPAVLNGWSSSFGDADAAQRALKFLAVHHQLRSIWLIAHQECAFYRQRFGPLDEEYARKRQLDDLRRAQADILAAYPHLVVHRVYAARQGSQVRFTVLADE
jgi:carbonic anhydrase